MANIIGEISDIHKITNIDDCNIMCADDNCICGDACEESTRCDDCKAKILGECTWEKRSISKMCDNCGECLWR